MRYLVQLLDKTSWQMKREARGEVLDNFTSEHVPGGNLLGSSHQLEAPERRERRFKVKTRLQLKATNKPKRKETRSRSFKADRNMNWFASSPN